jgi:beta-fructofuranosidase
LRTTLMEIVPTEHVLANAASPIPGFKGDALEVQIGFEWDKAAALSLNVRGTDDGRKKTTISYESGHLNVAGTKVPLPLEKDEKLKLHVFLDKSVLEVYAQDGRVCVTRVLDADPKEVLATCSARDARTARLNLHVWRMATAWQKP